jgi:hypothetical protein
MNALEASQQAFMTLRAHWGLTVGGLVPNEVANDVITVENRKESQSTLKLGYDAAAGYVCHRVREGPQFTPKPRTRFSYRSRIRICNVAYIELLFDVMQTRAVWRWTKIASALHVQLC